MTATVEDSYERLAEFGPEYHPLRLSNHGPMAAEAMVALGRAPAAVEWVEHYRQRLEPMPPRRERISGEQWQSALSAGDRHADWADFFAAELDRDAWPAVVDRWSSRLAPGMIGGALHGLLRAAHATRAMGGSGSALCRRELAQGLAHWAAQYHPLPSASSGGAVHLPVSAALRRIELVPEAQRRNLGLITDALAPLASSRSFGAVLDLVDMEAGDPGDLLSDVTTTFAGAYLANASRENLIALIHFITGPSAVRLLLPHVSPATARSLLARAWQAGAALYAVYGSTPVLADVAEEPLEREELIDRALRTRDEHAVKFTEACLREEDARPCPLFRAAARDAITRLAGNC